jgi:hypothetical protein
VRRQLTEVSGGGIVRFSPKFSVGLVARAGSSQFDESAVYEGQQLQDTLNDEVRTYGLTVRQRLTPLTSVAVLYEQQQDRFPHEPVRDTDSFRVMPGVEFRPRALVSGSAYVGYRSFNPKGRLVPADRGLVSQLGLSYTLRGATTFGVSYERDFRFSYDASTPYYLADNTGVFIRRQVGGNFDVIANAMRNVYDYQHVATPPGVPLPPARVETTHNYGLNLGYRLRRQTRVGAGASYWTREAPADATRAYAGYRFVMTVSSGITR